ncbi:hypothetical protein [Pseudoduganella sp.]|uniref:hypothetical protein n=1 Tax=Pseudoduganella sp. TaxID=1880898 RepID=UPI0035AD8FA1
MNYLNSIGPRSYQNTALTPAQPQQDGKTSRANAIKDVAQDNPVSLSSGAVDLQKRVDRLGNKTVDMAQDLIGSFARKLLGDDAKGATIDFDSVELEASSSFSAAALRSESAGGVTSALGFSLNEDSHFIGKGTITTADGRKLAFEVEIQYETSMTAAAASSVPSRRQDLASQNPAMPLPEVEFPDIDFPGSLADLFRLMDRNISATLKQLGDDGQQQDAGNLTMRLLKMVDAESPLDTYLPPNASDKAKAYGRQQAEPGQAAELAHAAKEARDAAKGGAIDPPAAEIDPPAAPAGTAVPAAQEPPAA